MDIFQKLPMAKRSAMELLFQNCTEKVKNYMFTMDVAAGQTFIQAGEPCINIVIILSGRGIRSGMADAWSFLSVQGFQPG